MGNQDELSIALPLVIADAKALAREDHANGTRRSLSEDGNPRKLFIALTKRAPDSLAGTGMQNVKLGDLIRPRSNYMKVYEAYDKAWTAAAEQSDEKSNVGFEKEPGVPVETAFSDAPLHDYNRDTQIGTRVIRPGQETFRTAVIDHYRQCAFCYISERELLDAAHVVPWCEYGVDELFNALVLCKLHHRALDSGFIRIALDENRTLRARAGGPTLELLHVKRQDISHLVPGPRRDALQDLWKRSATENASATDGTGEFLE